MRRSVENDTPGLLPNRACRNCVQIKVRCIPLEGSDNHICQRCHRLSKECTTPAPVDRKQRTKSVRVTQLEKRVDQLAAMLTPTQPLLETRVLATEPSAIQNTAAETFAVDTPMQFALPTPVSNATHIDTVGSSDPQPIIANRPGSPYLFIPHLPGRKDGSQLLNKIFCPVHMDPEFEHKLFADFHHHISKHFPFVVIDANVSAEDLKEKKPFTYWAGIYVASYRHHELNQKLFDELMRALGYRMLVARSKSLDLLQGILILMAWHHIIIHYNAQLVNLLHLAKALLIELSISEPVRAPDRVTLATNVDIIMEHDSYSSTTDKITSDEKRALLGCFCISSSSALTFRRMDPMRYSQHMDDCCRSLKLACEYESDLVLVELVQLYRLLGKCMSPDHGRTATSTAFQRMFQDEIQQLKDNMPPSLKGNVLLEVNIAGGSLNFLEPSYMIPSRDRIDYVNAFHNCVDIGHRMFDAFASLPVQELVHITLFVTTPLIQLIIVFFRLSFMKSSHWDIQCAWRTVDLGSILQRLEDVYNNVHQYELQNFPNPKPWRYAVYAQKAKSIRGWYEAKVAAEEAAIAPNTNEVVPDPFGDFSFENLDDILWHDLMGDLSSFTG